MKEFMKSNTITHNLMSFTGFKSMFIFSLLLEGPKTYKQIQDAIINHEYLHEKISIDAIRIYINSLKNIGCDITKETKNKISYYSIKKHPFELKIDENQTKSIIKVYNAISASISLEDFIALRNFFEKFASYITNDSLKNKLLNLSPIKNIDANIITDLIKYVNNKNEITILYKSANSGIKNITILSDKLFIQNKKLYLAGYNNEHKNYSSFLVSNIMKIISVNMNSPTLSSPTYKVTYELYKTDNTVFEPLENEAVIEDNKDKLVIEITSKNKFIITQRILYHASKCKVISPESYQEEVINVLKQMKEGYLE